MISDEKNDRKKKLLILGGGVLHCGAVETSMKMGIETYVTDYLPIEKSPAKQIANHAWDIDVQNYELIAAKCREEKIDGILNVHYDPCQIPYQKICEKLDLPCFANFEQYYEFTDKTTFLHLCEENGVDIIPHYSEADFATENNAIEYPVYVKPNDSRGTRGQSICRNKDEVIAAISSARRESKTGEVVIERFIENCQDIQLTYFMIDGEPYLEFIADKYNVTSNEEYHGSVVGGICPSVNEETIMSDANPKICRMLKKLGLRNTPVFLQGFLDGAKLRLYDPGLRLPGCLHEMLVKKATGFDVYKSMIIFALTGAFPQELKEVSEKRNMNGKLSVHDFIYIGAGKITVIDGLGKMRSHDKVVEINQRYFVGDIIENWGDIRNAFCEIAMLCDNINDAKQMINLVHNTIQIKDEQGKDMRIAFFDTDRLDRRYI